MDASLLHTRREEFLADVGAVRCLAFNKEGTLLAASGLANAESNTFCPGTPTVLVFDWATGQAKPPLGVREKVDGFIHAVRFLPHSMLAGYGEGTVGGGLWIWKPDSPDDLAKGPGPKTKYFTIVGVVANVRVTGLAEKEPVGMYYFPYGQGSVPAPLQPHTR